MTLDGRVAPRRGGTSFTADDLALGFAGLECGLVFTTSALDWTGIVFGADAFPFARTLEPGDAGRGP